MSEEKIMETAFIFIWGILALVMISIHIYEGTIVPLRKSVKKWVPVSCEVVSSKLEVDGGSEGPSFWIVIQYTYKYKNVDYISKKYSLTYQQSSYKRYHKRILDKYPKDLESICYVNPENPSEAVLTRENSIGIFNIIIIIIFLLLGIGMLLYALYRVTR